MQLMEFLFGELIHSCATLAKQNKQIKKAKNIWKFFNVSNNKIQNLEIPGDRNSKN